MVGKFVDGAGGQWHAMDFFRRTPSASNQYGRKLRTLYEAEVCLIIWLHAHQDLSSSAAPRWINQAGSEMRVALWSDATAQEYRGYMAISLAQPERFLQLIDVDDERRQARVSSKGRSAMTM